MNTIKKIFLIVAACFISISIAKPLVNSKSYILIEATTGMTLAQYRGAERMEPASITKLMTAYVVYQSIAKGIIDLSEKTTVSAKSRSMPGSRMFLEQGSRVSIDNLLNGLVIQSGNDAAIALAESVAGTEERFVEIMNKQAKALGMNDSQFKNASGLPEDGHYMSATDIATLARAIITDFPEYYKRYKKLSFSWNGITQANRNTLLKKDSRVDGLKTGHTDSAGYCLAASAVDNDMRLISVVLGTNSSKARAQAAHALLNYGFDNFSLQTLYQAQQTITQAGVQNGTTDRVNIGSAKSITLPLSKKNPTKDLSARLKLDTSLVAPISAGATVGIISIQHSGAEVARVPAVAMDNVEELGFFQRMWRSIVQTIIGWFS